MGWFEKGTSPLATLASPPNLGGESLQSKTFDRMPRFSLLRAQFTMEDRPMMNVRVSQIWAAALASVMAGVCFVVQAQDISKAAPPAAIPTFSTDDLARTGFFCAGGKYVGEKGKEVRGGAIKRKWFSMQERRLLDMIGTAVILITH